MIGTEGVYRLPHETKKYRIIRTIGKGGYSVVALGVDKKTNQHVAIKIMNRNEMIQLGMLSYLENELRLSERLEHPNIVKVFDVVYEEDYIMIVMEYLECGDLQTLLYQGYSFSIDDQLNIASQIVSAITYIHKRGICHRDIKPENILFDSEMRPKLIDFGLSREKSSKLNTLCGTSMYMPPEVLRGMQYDGKLADIWSLGVTLHVFNCSQFPFASSEAQYIREIQEGNLNINMKCCPCFVNIIRDTLSFDPAKRPGCDELYIRIENARGRMIRSNERVIKCGQTLPRLNFKNFNPNLQANARIKLSADAIKARKAKRIMSI